MGSEPSVCRLAADILSTVVLFSCYNTQPDRWGGWRNDNVDSLFKVNVFLLFHVLHCVTKYAYTIAGISSLGCIGECSALERLDLTNNDISKLYPLASLTNLTYLSLSRNRISSLGKIRYVY